MIQGQYSQDHNMQERDDSLASDEDKRQYQNSMQDFSDAMMSLDDEVS
jgi:hypothetical protein